MEDTAILTLVSAALYTTLFPPLNFAWLSSVTLVGFVMALHRSTTVRGAAWHGFLFGLAITSLFHLWIFELRAWAPLLAVAALWIALTLYSALFYALAASLYRWLCPTPSLWRPWLFAAIWTLAEWMRHIGPFGNTAMDFGYSQVTLLVPLQLASIGGIWFLSFWLALVNAAVAEAIPITQRRLYLSLAFGLIAAAYLIGGGLLTQRVPHHQTQPVTLIQPNIPQSLKFDRALWQRTRNQLLHQTALSGASPGTLVIWPETVIPALNLQYEDFMTPLHQLADRRHLSILWGTPVAEAGRYYNAMVLTSPRRSTETVYRKVRLMPFGEYIPFRSLAKAVGLGNFLLGEDYSQGPGWHPFAIPPWGSVGAMICMESLFPQPSRQLVRQGAAVLVTAANNAWFFRSPAAAQHFHMTRMRAVENRRTMVQVANTGISGIVDPYGRVTQISELGTRATLHAKIVLGAHLTLYTRLGDWIILTSGLLIGVFWLIKVRPFRKKDIRK